MLYDMFIQNPKENNLKQISSIPTLYQLKNNQYDSTK